MLVKYVVTVDDMDTPEETFLKVEGELLTLECVISVAREGET